MPGKTTTGEILAKLLDLHFIDLDRGFLQRHPVFLELACKRHVGIEDPLSIASRLAEVLSRFVASPAPNSMSGVPSWLTFKSTPATAP